MTPLRIAIVGTGAFAATHAQAIANSHAVTLSAVTDIDAERLAAFAKQWRVRGYANMGELLSAEQTDIVTVASNDETHAKLIQESLAHPQAPHLVIVEKPLCVTEKELNDLDIFLAKQKGKLVVDHSRRFNGGFLALRDMIAAQELGALRSVLWRYYSGWFHVGVHAVDTLRMLIGELRVKRATRGPADRFPQDPLLNVTLAAERLPGVDIELIGVPEHPESVFASEWHFAHGKIFTSWDDIIIERNGEKPERRKADTIESALENLYRMSAAMLVGQPSNLLDSAGFAVARGTMDILFEAKRVAS